MMKEMKLKAKAFLTSRNISGFVTELLRTGRRRAQSKSVEIGDRRPNLRFMEISRRFYYASPQTG